MFVTAGNMIMFWSFNFKLIARNGKLPYLCIVLIRWRYVSPRVTFLAGEIFREANEMRLNEDSQLGYCDELNYCYEPLTLPLTQTVLSFISWKQREPT